MSTDRGRFQSVMESFAACFRGHLQGIMTEEAYVRMAGMLEGDWYAVPFAGNPGEVEKISASQAGERLIRLYEEVKTRNSLSGKFPHTYVKDREAPVFIKLYDPVKCGGSCSTVAPDPWWVFSRVEPSQDELAGLFGKKKKK